MSSPIGDAIKAAITAIVPSSDKYSFDVVWEEIGKVLDGMLDTIGVVKMYAGAIPPTRWLLCDGRTIGKTGSGADLEGEVYHTLFDVIQNLYGGPAGPIWDNLDTVNIPDFGGIFPRGAGVSNTLTNANGAPFAGSTGHYENDKMQGHKHGVGFPGISTIMHFVTDASGTSQLAAGTNARGSATVGVPANDGVNGAPRTGTETNPANLALPFIIRY
jgi:microcystin-dependent protein